MKQVLKVLIVAMCWMTAAAQQNVPPTTTPYVNFTTGMQFNGNFGIAGQCAISTGTGTTWGSCASGSGNVVNQAVGVFGLPTAANIIGAQSHLDDGVTNPGTITSTEPIAAPTVAATKAVLSQGQITYTTIAPFGDSLTASFQERSGVTYPQQLATLAVGKTVTGNYGYPGQTSTQIAVRMNAYPANQTVTVSGGTIPASGGVTVTFPAGYEAANGGDLTVANCFQMIIKTTPNVTGCVSKASGVYTFTRSTSGSSISSPANTPWVPDFTSVLVPGQTLEIIEAGENNRSNPGLVLTDVAAMVAAVKARGDQYFVVGLINADTDTCSTCSQAAKNASTNASLSASYAPNFLDLNTALVANGNPSVPADALNAAVQATPLSMKAWDGTITLTAAMTDTTTCPLPANWTYTPFPNSGASLPSTSYGATFYFNDTGEFIYFNSLTGSYTTTGCIRGYNGSTATTHLNGATAKTTDGLHLANNSSTQAPALSGIPGYTFMANKVWNGIGASVSNAPLVITPNSDPNAYASADGSKFMGWGNGGLNINTSILPTGGASAFLGNVNYPWEGLQVNEAALRGFEVITYNNAVLTSGGVNFQNLTYPFNLTNAGTSGYTTANDVATTTSGSGSGMILKVIASGGVITSILIENNGTGYAINDKVFPTQAGSSADAFITLTGDLTQFPYGSLTFAGTLYPAVQGASIIGTSLSPFGGIFLQDGSTGHIIIGAGTGRLISTVNGFTIGGNGLIAESGSHPQVGSVARPMGTIAVSGQSTGAISLVNANSGSFVDSVDGGWKMTNVESTTGTLILPTGTGQTSGKVIGTCGTATQFGPCNLASTDMPATGTWFESGYTSSVAANAFVQNQTVFYAFAVRNTVTATQISYRIQTGDNTANLYDIGIYNSTGSTLLAHIGATAGTSFASSAANKVLNLAASVTLTPGTYQFAYTTNCASACAVLAGNNVSILAPQSGSAGGATSGGALGSSITPGSTSWTAASTGFPWFAIH